MSNTRVRRSPVGAQSGPASTLRARPSGGGWPGFEAPESAARSQATAAENVTSHRKASRSLRFKTFEVRARGQTDCPGPGLRLRCDGVELACRRVEVGRSKNLGEGPVPQPDPAALLLVRGEGTRSAKPAQGRRPHAITASPAESRRLEPKLAAWAHSSIGQSPRLITGLFLVRTQVGPLSVPSPGHVPLPHLCSIRVGACGGLRDWSQ